MNEPAYPTTPVSHGYSSDSHGGGTGAGTGLTKLERVASEQLAALLAHESNPDWAPAFKGADFAQDNAGHWCYANGQWQRATTATPMGERYALKTTHQQRLVRYAIEMAKELLEQLR